jgi:hypothetical protein
MSVECGKLLIGNELDSRTDVYLLNNLCGITDYLTKS